MPNSFKMAKKNWPKKHFSKQSLKNKQKIKFFKDEFCNMLLQF